MRHPLHQLTASANARLKQNHRQNSTLLCFLLIINRKFIKFKVKSLDRVGKMYYIIDAEISTLVIKVLKTRKVRQAIWIIKS